MLPNAVAGLVALEEDTELPKEKFFAVGGGGLGPPNNVSADEAPKEEPISAGGGGGGPLNNWTAGEPPKEKACC